MYRCPPYKECMTRTGIPLSAETDGSEKACIWMYYTRVPDFLPAGGTCDSRLTSRRTVMRSQQQQRDSLHQEYCMYRKNCSVPISHKGSNVKTATNKKSVPLTNTTIFDQYFFATRVVTRTYGRLLGRRSFLHLRMSTQAPWLSGHENRRWPCTRLQRKYTWVKFCAQRVFLQWETTAKWPLLQARHLRKRQSQCGTFEVRIFYIFHVFT